jgi:CMP-N-acetylneuraminic acid synthetase
MKAVAFIFARAGSKGLPGKNTKLFAGKPLIAWSIQCALSVKEIERVIVSTDSPQIAEVSREYGAETPFIRPPELATDESPEWLSWRHGIEFLQNSTGALPDAFVSLPATSPLRESSDIEGCIGEFGSGSADIVITITDSQRNPYFNMVKRNENRNFDLVMATHSIPSRRQDAPEVFDVATVCYVAKPEFILTHNSIFEGRVGAVHIPRERAIDIDTLLDFKVAEYLFELKD